MGMTELTRANAAAVPSFESPLPRGDNTLNIMFAINGVCI